MNRKNLTAAVLAGLAGAAGIVGSAQAVNINPDGLGQVLLYPYYTVNGGNITLLSVVNTTGDAKAVKVRFLEGQNSREVLDFNLYMSEYDVWTASLKMVNDTPRLKTGDTSCTVPYIYGNGGTQDFLPWALDDGYYNDRDVDGYKSKVYDDISRGAEGHFEMIEMGTLVDEEVENMDWVDLESWPICDDDQLYDPSGNFVPGASEPPFYGYPASCLLPRYWTSAELDEDPYLVGWGSASAATHVEGGEPADCQQLVDAWTENLTSKTDGYWIEENFIDIESPSGGLFGGAAVVNVQAGTMYSYDAKAIDGFWGEGADHDDSHQEPGTILPSLDSGGENTGTVFVKGEIADEQLDRGVDAVSYVLMHDQVMNEYTTESAVGAGTEWVITFPTKQFYVHAQFLIDYAALRGDDFPYGAYDISGNTFSWDPIAPFTSEWYWVNTTYDSKTDEVKKPGYQVFPCEIVTLSIVKDREEGVIPKTPGGPNVPKPPIVSPAPPSPDDPDPEKEIPFELCYETSVIEFAEAHDGRTGILGSENFHTFDVAYETGWAAINMVEAEGDWDGDGDTDYLRRESLGHSSHALNGLPVTGFAVQRFQNAFLGDGADVLANYGGIFQHKYTRLLGSYID